MAAQAGENIVITSAWFKSFKLLQEVSLTLGRLNVIVGRNSVGKTTVLEGLHLLLQLNTPQPGEDRHVASRPGVLFSGQRAISRLATRPDAQGFELGIRMKGNTEWGIRAQQDPQSQSDAYSLWSGPHRLELPTTSNPRLFFDQQQDPPPLAAQLKLHASAIAADHYSEQEVPVLADNGAGLPSVLQYLQGLRDGTLEAIEAQLVQVVPTARRIRALPSKIRQQELVRVALNGQESWHNQWRTVTGARFEIEFQGMGWIPADLISEGTLLALGLITRLQHQPPGLLLLDDIDQGLHPVAQRTLISLIRAILDGQQDLQVVATSHSPFVLDALDGTEAFVAGTVSPTASRIRRLDAHPAWKARKGFMHPGEFWSAVGEGWVAEEEA